MKFRCIIALIVGVGVAPVTGGETIYKSDSRGNVSQITYGVGETRRLGNNEVEARARSSQTARKEMALRPFSRLVVRVPADVTYEQGSRHFASVSGGGGALDAIQFRQSGSSLIIESNDGFQNTGNIGITISSLKLERVELYGTAEVELKRIRTPGLSISLEGTVDLEAQGRVERCQIEASGASSADLGQLKCGRAEIAAEGLADLDLFVADEVAGSVLGVGDVRVSGRPRVRKLEALDMASVSYD